jgi:hypothetical protein
MKQKKMMQRNSSTAQPKENINGVTNTKNIRPILGTLCVIIRQRPFFR